VITICPIAADLDWADESRTKVAVGSDTRVACDVAVNTAKRIQTGGEKVEIVPTACEAPNYHNEWMASVMSGYMKTLHCQAPIIPGKALSFDTWGEMRSLAFHVWENRMRGIKTKKVILVVKWWHAPRVCFTFWYWRLRFRVRNVKVEVVKCPSLVGPKMIVHEIGGVIKYSIRMLFRKFD